jgi:tetratricopeptide (TPR) repeat protein
MNRDNGGRLAWALLTLAVATTGLRGQEPAPELTPEQQQLRKEAVKLFGEGMALSRQARLPEATERLQKAVALLQRVYPKDKYPNGHPDLAGSLNNLGLLLQAQGEYGKAEPLYRQALEMNQKLYPKDKFPDGHPDLAASLGWLGTLLQAEGEYGKAEPFLRQALEMYQKLYPKEQYPNGHPLLAVGLHNLGLLLQLQGEYGKAEPFLRQALEMNQKLYPKEKHPNGHPELATSLNTLGLLLEAQGESAKAEPFLRQALEMLQKLYPMGWYPNGHPDLAKSLNNLASLLRAQGEYAKAEPFFRQALEMDQKLYPKEKYPNGHPDLAGSLNNLGYLLQAQGEYGKAETFARQALEMFQKLYPKEQYPNGHPELADSLNNLGLLLQAQGESAKAEPLLRQALEMNQKLYPKEKYPNGHPHLAISLNTLGFVLEAQGEYAKAETFYRQALEMRQQLYPKDKFPYGHPLLAVGLNNLGGLLFVQGEYTKAETLLRQALEMNQKLYPKEQYPNGHPELADSLNNLGFLLQAQGEYGKAEPFHRQALEMRSQQARRLAQTAPEPIALNYASTFPLIRDVLLSVTGHLPGSEARTYAAVWHSKAAITRVYQRRHLALIAAATDESVRKDWDKLQLLRRQREQVLMAPATKDTSARDEKLKQLNDELDRVEKDLLPRLPALKHSEDLALLGPEALQKLLADDAVLIDFVRYTHFEYDPDKPGKRGEKRTVRYLAFVVSRQQIQRVELETATEINEAVQAWRGTITQKLPAGNEQARREHEARLARQAEKLRQLVWEPVQQQLPEQTRTVYLAPDGDLTQVPWAALPGRNKDSVLLDDYALAVLPHGPFLLEQLSSLPPRSAKRPRPPEGLLLVGGVRYDDKPAAGTQTAQRGSEAVVGQQVRWDYLQGTEEERLLLAKLLAKTGPKLTATLAGAEAATERLHKELEQARYAHVATHGFFADKQFRSVLQLDEKLFERIMYPSGDIGRRIGEGARSPLVLSGLVCAGANLPDTPDRGILSADAIAGLLLDDLQLATLSACDTGLGDVAGGEGVFGLQRAFHIAGCKNVVASLWKVDDAATAALMTRFYGHLFAEDKDKRLPPIEALRRAQLELYRHPELIPAWAKGEQRAPGKPRPATTPPPPETPPELVTSAGRAPIRLWAAFTLSGSGR